MAGLMDMLAAAEARAKAVQPPREPLPGNPKTLMDLLAAAEARAKAAQPPREPLPGNPKTLSEIAAAVSARLGQPWPPVQPDYDQVLPSLPDNATPAEIAFRNRAAHGLFMASVASPAPRRRGRDYGN